jgi:hypothetical protein
MDDFVKKEYHETVTTSDEAFVWVIMDAYYNRWKINKKGRAGAVFGVQNTVSKKKAQFQEYDMTAGDSRKTENALLWSEKLMEVAKSALRLIEEYDDDGDDEIGEAVQEEEDTTKENAYINRMKNSLGEDSSDDDEDEGGDVDDTTNDGDDNGFEFIPRVSV